MGLGGQPRSRRRRLGATSGLASSRGTRRRASSCAPAAAVRQSSSTAAAKAAVAGAGAHDRRDDSPDDATPPGPNGSYHDAWHSQSSREIERVDAHGDDPQTGAARFDAARSARHGAPADSTPGSVAGPTSAPFVSENTGDARRRLPSVTSLLVSGGVQALLEQTPRAVVVDAIRLTIDAARL